VVEKELTPTRIPLEEDQNFVKLDPELQKFAKATSFGKTVHLFFTRVGFFPEERFEEKGTPNFFAGSADLHPTQKKQTEESSCDCCILF
jgi:hypothetical protein